jgi:hypothetical protein
MASDCVPVALYIFPRLRVVRQQTILDESKFDHTDILYAAMYQVVFSAFVRALGGG